MKRCRLRRSHRYVLGRGGLIDPSGVARDGILIGLVFKQHSCVRNKQNKQSPPLQNASSVQEANEEKREEWMLVPPKSLGVLGAVKTLQPTNRKFQM